MILGQKLKKNLSLSVAIVCYEYDSLLIQKTLNSLQTAILFGFEKQQFLAVELFLIDHSATNSLAELTDLTREFSTQNRKFCLKNMHYVSYFDCSLLSSKKFNEL